MKADMPMLDNFVEEKREENGLKVGRLKEWNKKLVT